MAHQWSSRHFQFAQRVTALKKVPRGVLLTLDAGTLRIEFVRDDMLRLKFQTSGAFDEQPTHAVCARLPRPPRHVLRQRGNECILTGVALEVRITRAPFNLTVTRRDGTVVCAGVPAQDGQSRLLGTLNDEFIVTRVCGVNDPIYGLGEKTGRLNRRGRQFTFWNTDVLNPVSTREFTEHLPATQPAKDPSGTAFDPYYMSIPLFHHLDHETGAAAGFFIDNGYRGHFDFSDGHAYRFHFSGGQYTEYIFAGPALKDILAGYTWLTGRMAAPPLWALGHHQCRWFRYTQADVTALAGQYRRRGIPCDVIWLDIDYMDGYRVFTWNKKIFPQPQRMLARLKQRGFRAITIIDPGVKMEPGYAVFDDGAAKDVFCKTEGGVIYAGQVWPGKTAFPDFTLPAARAWWGARNAAHVRSGLAGIWNDMNEPATGDIPPQGMRFTHGRHAHERFHNQYAMLMAMGTVDGLRAAMPDKRTFVLSRAGSAGIQRYAANWMGDNMARWDHLWMSLPMGLGLGLSGQPFIGTDVGGFAEHTHAELLARWYQYAALTPFFRNHLCIDCREHYPWSFGAAIEAICRDAIRLRYRLMPYLYATFMRAAETGHPIQTPLVFAAQDDRAAREIDDQFLCGEHLLVAPVYQPGCTARPVYLPHGTWHDWHTGEVLEGGQFITAPAPPDRMPLYARGGAVIPQWPEPPQSTMDYQPARVALHIFLPREDGRWASLLHEDDGVTFGFQKGAFYRTRFVLAKRGKRVTLAATVTGKGFPAFRRTALRLVFHGAAVSAVLVNGTRVAVRNGTCDLANAGAGFAIVIAC